MSHFVIETITKVYRDAVNQLQKCHFKTNGLVHYIHIFRHQCIGTEIYQKALSYFGGE